jgi:hypothetical protein
MYIGGEVAAQNFPKFPKMLKVFSSKRGWGLELASAFYH